MQAYDGSTLDLFVTEASLAGDPLELAIGQPFTIAARNVGLAGRFAEGQSFEHELASVLNHAGNADFISPNATLTVTRVLHPGDYDGSGVVDHADYPIWLAAITSGDLAADGNYDRQVTEADLQVWQERFGTDYRMIPEARAALLAAIGMLALTAYRRAS
jgi:hypothetical protein